MLSFASVNAIAIARFEALQDLNYFIRRDMQRLLQKIEAWVSISLLDKLIDLFLYDTLLRSNLLPHFCLCLNRETDS